MAQVIDVEAYNDMISALSEFITQVSEACDDMEAAANDCVANMEEDDVSTKSSAKLATCITAFRATLETAQNVISAMQEELEEAEEASRRIDDLD